MEEEKHFVDYFNWEKINTEMIKDVPTDILLEQVKNSEVLRGFGTIAEVCKRLSKLSTP